GSATQDHGNAQGGSCPGGGQLSFPVKQALHSDWCEENGCWELGVEDAGAPGPARQVAEDSRLDPPPAKRGEGGPLRVCGSGAAGEIAERLSAQQLAGALLQGLGSDRHQGAAVVDLDL